MALLDPGRAEDGDAVVDVAQGVEAALDLVVDPLQAEVVFGLDVAGDAEQVLVALGPGARDLASVVVHGQMPPAGLEPATRGLKGRRSNQLSYRGEAPMVEGH